MKSNEVSGKVVVLIGVLFFLIGALKILQVIYYG